MAGIDYIARWQQAISQERGSEEPPLLAYAYKACSELYAALLAGLRDDPLIDPLVKISLERSHGYLVLWADGYGVSEGQLDSSLDRSRRARHSTIRLLVSICKTLTKCLLPNVAKEKQAQLSPKAAAVIEAADKLKYLIQQDQTNDSESDSDTSSDASSTCGVSELDDIAEDLQTDVQCLLDLGSRFVEQTVGPVPTEKAVDPADIIDWHPSKNFIDRIRWRFPRCDEDVAKRLGIANWERVLRYQDTKHRNTRPQKLTSGEPMATPVKSAASGIVASTTFHDSGLGSSIPSVPSIPAASQYAETVVSYCGGQGDAVRLPPLPQEAKRGISFPCVGCGILINVGNKSAWKKHLFQDLQPYMCLDRICIVNGAAFTTKDAWENHLVLDHRFSVNWDGIVCPVCKETIKSGKLHVTTHLARHMEEIALTVLPTNPDSEDGTDVDSGLASSEISVRDNLAGHFDGIPDTDKGADVNAQGRLYGNALQAAFKEENDKTAQVTSILNDYSASGGDCFLEKGADVNAQGGKYGNALQDASYKGHDKIVQVLVDKGVDVNAQGGLYGNALQAAFKEENDDMAQAIRDMIARSASLEEWLPTTAIERIDSYLLEPLLKDESLESFYSLISEVRERLETGMLLREVETALMVGARERASNAGEYQRFCLLLLNSIKLVFPIIKEPGHTRLRGQPYDDEYFYDAEKRILRTARQMNDEKGSTAVYTARKPKEHSTDSAKEHVLSAQTTEPEKETPDQNSIVEQPTDNQGDSPDPMQCNYPGCSKIFKRPCDLNKHQKKHVRPWKCPVPTCKYSEYGWPTEKELDRHVGDKHSATPAMFDCLFKPCPYKSKRESHCKQHMEKAHGWTYVRSKNNGSKTVKPQTDEKIEQAGGLRGKVSSLAELHNPEEPFASETF